MEESLTFSPSSSLKPFCSLLNEVLEEKRDQKRQLRLFCSQKEVEVTKSHCKLSYLEYRKELKKTKRKMKRRIEAVRIDAKEREARKRRENEETEKEKKLDKREWSPVSDAETDEEQIELDEIEAKLRQHEAWLERENAAKLQFEKKREEENLPKKESQENDVGKTESVEAGSSANNESSWQEIEKKTTPDHVDKKDNCDFFMRTGVCRYGLECQRQHPEPEFGTTVVILGMFSHSLFTAAFSQMDGNGDITLDNPNPKLQKVYDEFYEDTLPEFQKIGRVKQFKVCSNQAKHLRGNVYVSYEREEEAFVAVQVFKGRWYAGRQLPAKITVIKKWRPALCGQYYQNNCPKGRRCNLLHCFINPEDAFAHADRDVEEAEGAPHRPRILFGKPRLAPSKARTPSPPGKHRPFRFRDHYVEDERIWKKRTFLGKEKSRESPDSSQPGSRNRHKREEEEREERQKRDTSEKRKKKKKDKKEKRDKKKKNDSPSSQSNSSDSDEDFCDRARKLKRKKLAKKSRRRSSSSSSKSSRSDSSDEVEKKILKVTLKTIRSKKSKRKLEKKLWKKDQRKQDRRASDTTDSSWDSDALEGDFL